MDESTPKKRTFTDAERADIFTRYSANPKMGRQLAAEYKVTNNVIRGLIFRERQRRATLAAGGHAPAGSNPELVGPGSSSVVAFQRLPPLECLQDLLAVFTAKAKASRKAHMATRDTGAFIREVVEGIIRLEERKVKIIDVTPQITREALGRLTMAEVQAYFELQRKMAGGNPIALAYDPETPTVYNPERLDDTEAATTPQADAEPGPG